MQVFLTDLNNLDNSARFLDNKRLLKQLVEIQQMFNIYVKIQEGEENIAYKNHPVVKHYYSREGVWYLFDYAKALFKEYKRRFKKLSHKSYTNIVDSFNKLKIHLIPNIDNWKPKFIYNNISTSLYVAERYKDLLLTKWSKKEDKQYE